jgi:ankyrin repeat protein
VEKNSDAEEMLLAATTGDLATVRRLLAAGVSPNVADRRGWTPLLSASALGDSAILHALVNAGADVNLRDAMDLTALQFAARRYPDLADFRFLLDKGADVNNEGKGILDAPVLFTAISHGDPALTLELLQRGAHPNRSPTTVSNLLDPIEHAVDLLGRQANDENRREIVKLLLRFGADPNLKRTNSRSLLYYPVASDNVALVKFLLDAGIDPRKDRDGGKAVAEQAERYGSKEMKAVVKAALAPAAR